jgi:hypothetical protein
MMSLSFIVKTRSRKRARSSGAVIFVVAMTLVVLGSMGAYALRAASTETRTSGYARASTQTRYLTEYGALGVVHKLQPPYVDFFDKMLTNPDRPSGALGRPSCLSLAAVPSTETSLSSRPCYVFTSEDASDGWSALSSSAHRNPLDRWTAANATGSFGTKIGGNFRVEVTEPRTMPPPPGFAQASNVCFRSYTLTSIAVTFPDLASNESVGILAGQNMITGRARVTGGPVSSCEGQ